MTLRCPKCGSTQTETRDRARRFLAAIGVCAGAASNGAAAWAGARKGARVGAEIGATAGVVASRSAFVGAVAGAALGALIGGVTGCTLGTALGERIDDNVMRNNRCLRCGHEFGMSASSDPSDPTPACRLHASPAGFEDHAPSHTSFYGSDPPLPPQEWPDDEGRAPF